MKLGHLNIPKLEPDAAAFDRSVDSRLFSLYLRVLDETDAGTKALAMLNDDPRVQALEGKMLSTGNGAARFSVRVLAMWFLWTWNEYGQEAATEYLEAYLDADQVDVVCALWVVGIKVQRTLELSDGYRLVPLEEMPDSWEKEQYQAFGRKFHPQLPPPPEAAICRTCKVTKASLSDETAGSPAADPEFWESASHLKEIALLLNAVDSVACLPYASTCYFLRTTPMGPFTQNGSGLERHEALGRACFEVTDEMAKVLDELLAAYASATTKEQARLRRMLSRLSQARRRDQIEDRVLDLGIALEMALLDDNKKEQLTQSFRLRGSWLVAENAEERLQLYRDLGDLYGYRSQVAHCGILCDNKPNESEAVWDKFPHYSSLAGRIVRSIILKGKPDWTRLVLGSAI